MANNEFIQHSLSYINIQNLKSRVTKVAHIS